MTDRLGLIPDRVKFHLVDMRQRGDESAQLTKSFCPFMTFSISVRDMIDLMQADGGYGLKLSMMEHGIKNKLLGAVRQYFVLTNKSGDLLVRVFVFYLLYPVQHHRSG